jgi:hypothetical protein
VGLPPRLAAVGALRGTVVFMRDIFILNEIRRKKNIHFWLALYLVEIFYLSVSIGTVSEQQAGHFVAD